MLMQSLHSLAQNCVSVIRPPRSSTIRSMTDSAPPPRLCLDAASISGSLNGHQAKVCRALERMDPSKFLRELADRIEDLNFDDVRLIINVCLIMREHRDNAMSKTTYNINVPSRTSYNSRLCHLFAGPH
jgi:hypothetical protein